MVDLRNLPGDIINHAKLRFHHTRNYNTLQKLAYGGVLFIILPFIILTGLAMSPSMNAVIPFLADVLGGRQTARTIHFAMMLLLVGFFIVHILMIVAAGPLIDLHKYTLADAAGRQAVRDQAIGWITANIDKSHAQILLDRLAEATDMLVAHAS